jgi:hypothetical protein
VNGSKQKAPLRYNVFGGTVGGPMNRSFNTDAFAPPAPFTFGNSGRGILRGDGIINFDFSLAKNVALGPFDGGKSRSARFLQLRVELFNAFNHPNFGLPGHTFGAPDSGLSPARRAGGRFNWGSGGSFESYARQSLVARR